jgi:DNA-binding Lrp family transcriptional regulator
VVAYVLIQTAVGKGRDVTVAVGEVRGVTAAESVTGPYDVIARIETRDLSELSKVVVGAIQGIEGISRTLTCPIVHAG